MEGDCFVVLDAFALPVEGTETRVNAQQEAYEYIIDFAETNKVSSPPLRTRKPKPLHPAPQAVSPHVSVCSSKAAFRVKGERSYTLVAPARHWLNCPNTAR